ncbi:DUF503 domain-containing protein [Gordonia sp. TBRC 11910]|uniref:DUF503 domain-containing protein n=1 Tax=Gordonia asplenii TaxID=2725283 RepID=A0A848KPA8_9ACTN|nr:DUF503 domain-containing protein [Gordonia asplenii]NMN99756.1 DUF503 domain-containing protein [Gordonia asplenii]
MWIGWIEFDVLLGDVHSLKEKRSVIRPVIAEIKRKYSVSAAEVGNHDLHRRAGIGAGVVGPDQRHVADVLDSIEHLVARRPEIEINSARRRVVSSEDF